ncbi:Rrf2 family transcriptional regulator [Paenibacillus sp. 7124]|uniref:Rrf2 family transcriptional regulator n=1 Tax=Paenibacillus apii TaxID=1850370 RepID=A0A6M1PQH9_9BACL|nr:Rrf2 family transcriptional regulator [Paenibacillus apii]NGM84365.1 Rrf2 family transcriptional regulator [Paenibacillus apii]NJJ38315.1 Rrf2 family transcriptional regulator [Paenibacillus apii]
MKLTAGLEQAAAIVVLLATQDTKLPLASDEISRILEVSPSYLKKLIRKLVIQGIVNSVPGTKGGITLAKQPEELSMLDLIEAIEGPIDMYKDTGLLNHAFKDGRYAENGTEVVKSVFAGANHLLSQYFSSITAADLLEKSMGNTALPKLDWNTMTLAEFLKEE